MNDNSNNADNKYENFLKEGQEFLKKFINEQMLHLLILKMINQNLLKRCPQLVIKLKNQYLLL